MIQPIHVRGSLRPSTPIAAPAIVVRVVRFRLQSGTLTPRAAIAQLVRGGASRDVATATVYGR